MPLSVVKARIIAPILLIVYFLLAGAAILPRAGLQNDEVLFGAGVYDPRHMPAYLSVFQKPFALMILPYLGALKAWLYAPLFAVWSPSVWSVRVPVLLLGALTIWLFYRLACRLLGRGAAVAAGALLATDTTFLLTTCFDWGPVVLQRFLAVASVLLLVRFHDTGSARSLGIGFFFFGLALWDKALFGWTLAGLGVGLLAVAPGVLRRAVTAKRLAVATACFLLGAYPLLRYNQRHPFETLKSTVGWTTEGQRGKLQVLASSLDGSSLLGYLTVDDPADQAKAPRTRFEKGSVWLDDVTGSQRHGWLGYALALSILLLPFVWRTPARPPAVFALVVLLVAYGLMFFAKGGGAATHHVSLLWPWPHLIVAAGFTGVSRRFGRAGPLAVALVVGLISAGSVLATNVYLSQFIRNGAAGSWSDAVFQLSGGIADVPPAEVVVLDWGIFEPLRTLHRGRLALIWGGELVLTPSPSADDLRAFEEMLRPPGRLFVSHTDSQEQFSGVNARFRRMLADAGYQRRSLQVVRDSNGRPVFELFQAGRP